MRRRLFHECSFFTSGFGVGSSVYNARRCFDRGWVKLHVTGSRRFITAHYANGLTNVPSFQFRESLYNNPTVHLQDFQRVARGILGNQVLDLSASESNISLAEQRRDVIASNMSERILSVLQLSESLRSQTKLRLGHRSECQVAVEFGRIR